jgi:hypothetical protein
MTQPVFDFTTLYDVSVTLPVSGETPIAQHCSSYGAQVAARSRGALATAYLQLLASAGHEGLSDDEAANALGRRLSSINSTRNGLGDLIVPSGSVEKTEFGTRRARWTLAVGR